MERNEGILERTLVNGITGTEVLFSQVITQFVVMFGQTAMVLLFAFPIFQLTQNGNWFLLFSLTILSGVCGMCFGKRARTMQTRNANLIILQDLLFHAPAKTNVPQLTWLWAAFYP